MSKLGGIRSRTGRPLNLPSTDPFPTSSDDGSEPVVDVDVVQTGLSCSST